MLQELGFANAKSYREFVESAKQAAKLHDRRRSSVVQTINISKQLFSGFMRERRVEQGIIDEDDYSSDSSEDGLLEDSISTMNSSNKAKFIDENNVLVDLKAPHIAQQQQRPTQNGYGQNLEMVLTPLYDVDLYLHFDKKKRKIRRRLYPYLTRLQNSRNDKEYIRIRPLLQNAGYANNSLWSKRSVQLEQTLRAYLKVNSMSNKGSSTSLVSGSSASSTASLVQYIHENVGLYNKIPVGCNISFVDTFWSDDDCNPNLELIHRFTSSDGTAITQERSLHKETYRQLEFDLLLLNMVNDYMSLYKQIHSPAGFEQFLIENNILHDNTHLIKVLKKRNEVAEIFNEIYEQHFASNKEEKIQENPEISGDGNYKCEGMLIGIAASNDIHIRPLCTSADMSLAINELQDPRVFKCGYIAMPHMLQMNLERITDGFYRFEYHAKDGFSIKYMRITLPTADRDLRPFMGMASYTMTSECYEEEWLYTTVKDLNNRKGASPKRKGGILKINKAIRNGSLVPPVLLEFCNHLIRVLNDIYRKYTKVILSIIFDIEALMVLKDYQKSSISGPPHRTAKDADAEQIQYRVLSMHHVEVRECLTHFRRKAICTMDGIQRNYLKDFYMEFKKEWNTIINQSHTIENIEDFYSLSAAQRSAIRYAHKVYNRLRESGNTDSDVFELDAEDIDKEFLKELEYRDVPSPAREKNHLQSKALIDQYRPPEITPTDAELLQNPDLQPIPDMVLTTNEEIIAPVKPPLRSLAITSQQTNRRSSKLDRKQSTMRSLKKKKFSTSMRLKPNESDSDLSVGAIEEVDPFEIEKQTAGIQYVDSFLQEMQSADQSAFSQFQQSRLHRMQHNKSRYQTITPNDPLSYIDPYNKKLKILCDSNSSKSYHQSFSASKELLCPDDVFPKPSECSPWKDKNKRAVKKLQLLNGTTDEADKAQSSSSDEDHVKDYRHRNPFPYVEKLNREAYRLAEKLDILTVMMLGLDSKTIDTTREKVKEKTKAKHKPATKAANVAASATAATSTSPSPQQTPVPSTTPNGTIKKQFTFESISPTQSNDQSSSKGYNSQNFKSGDLDQSGDCSEDGLGIQIDKSPVRAYLRRFSQRFKGIIQEDIIYSDTDSEKDPAEEDSDASEPRVLGLTAQDKKAEEHKILETILTSIDPKLSERIRKGLALREERLRLMRRQQYIRRRRRQEDLSEDDVKKLKEYFDSLPPNDHPFSSSSSEDEDVSLTSAGVDYKMEAIPINVTFKRMRGNTIRKSTPTPLYLHLEHRSTNVTIDPTFYERLSSRQSTIASSGSTTPFPSRPNTTRHSMLIGNVTFDGLGLPKDQSKANIWEQMTDTLSSMCDEVDDEAANFQHFQQHRQRRMGVTMLVNRTGGKLWGDNVGSTMIVSRKENTTDTILEGSTISTSAGKTDSSSRSAATSSVILLQISHFATEYCYELFAVAISSVTDRIVSGELQVIIKPKDHRSGKSRSSFRAISSRSSVRSPVVPIPDIRRSTVIEKFSRKTKFNLVDEFNNIFDEPLRPEYQLSKQRLLQTGSKKIRFDDELEENERLVEIDDEQTFQNFSQETCEENDSTNIFGSNELQDLLEGMKSNQAQKVDPLRSTMPTTAGSAKRPYSCGILANNEMTRDRLDSVQKYLNILKPKSSHASRMEYDEQTRSQWKQKSNKMPIIPPNVSCQQKTSQVPSAKVKFGVKGVKALTEMSSPSKEGMDRKYHKFRETFPESDEEFGSQEASKSVCGWGGGIAEPENLQNNNVLMHVHGDSHTFWGLEGHSIQVNHNQSDSTIQEDNQVKSSSMVHEESLEDSQSSKGGDLKLSNLLAIHPPTDSVISYPSVSQLNKKVEVIFQDDIDDNGDSHETCEGFSSSLVLPYPKTANVECDDSAPKYDGGRILNVKSICIDRQEDESAKSEKYIASSMISSIYNSQSYYEQTSRHIEIVRSPSPPNKQINISTFGHPPSLSIKPSAFSPNQRKRMIKASPISVVEAKSTISNTDKTNNGMEGILKTSRPITTSTRLRQSDYMK